VCVRETERKRRRGTGVECCAGAGVCERDCV